MATPKEILQRLLSSLSLQDPEWDILAGSPEYKILEAVSTELSGVFQNNLLHDYHFDIDSKAGAELDRFVALFGMKRRLGTRATGTVILSRGTPATADIDIPAGVQVVKPSLGGDLTVYFQTTAAGTIGTGLSSVEVPVEAEIVGTTGNVVAGAISVLGTGVTAGITAVSNPTAITGGTNIETDAQLRARWTNERFRNLAGTEDQYLGLALDVDTITKATVIGPVERHREQLQIVAGAVTSQIADASYIYPSGGEFFGRDIGSASEVMGVRGSDYSYASSNPPVFTIINTTDYPNGDVIDIEFEYTPKASRNAPSTGLLHKVDIFVAGQRAAAVDEELVFRNTSTYTFNNTAGNAMLRTQWLRENETTAPTNGNYFVPLSQVPLIELPSSIVVGATTYIKDTDYWKVRDTTTNYGSMRARDGIEWLSTHAPANNTVVTVPGYTYNQAVRQADDSINVFRPVGTDTLVHAARRIRLRFHLAIVFGIAYSPDIEVDHVAAALTSWLEGKGFRDNVQISDMIDVVKGVPSVDNVRLTTTAEDAVNHGIMKIAENGTTILSTFTSDIYLAADEIAELESVVVVARGQNTF